MSFEDQSGGEENGAELGMDTFGQPADPAEQTAKLVEETQPAYNHNANPHSEAGISSSRLHERMDAMGDVADPVGYQSTRARPWRKPAEEIKGDLGGGE